MKAFSTNLTFNYNSSMNYRIEFGIFSTLTNDSQGVLFGREEYMLAQVPSIFIIVALRLWVNVIFDYSFYVGFNRYV